MTNRRNPRPLVEPPLPADAHDFVLYIAGLKPASQRALRNLQAFCHQRLPGRHRIAVVDVTADPAVVRALDIIALPTLIRRAPHPARFIGDLSDTRALAAILTDPDHD